LLVLFDHISNNLPSPTTLPRDITPYIINYAIHYFPLPDEDTEYNNEEELCPLEPHSPNFHILATICLVSKSWYSIASQHPIWKEVCTRYFKYELSVTLCYLSLHKYIGSQLPGEFYHDIIAVQPLFPRTWIHKLSTTRCFVFCCQKLSVAFSSVVFFALLLCVCWSVLKIRSTSPSCYGYIDSIECKSQSCCNWNDFQGHCNNIDGYECNPQKYGILILVIGFVFLVGLWICVMVIGQCHQYGGKFWEWCQNEDKTPLLDKPRLKRCQYLKNLWKDKISALKNVVVDLNVDSILVDPSNFFREIKL